MIDIKVSIGNDRISMVQFVVLVHHCLQVNQLGDNLIWCSDCYLEEFLDQSTALVEQHLEFKLLSSHINRCLGHSCREGVEFIADFGDLLLLVLIVHDLNDHADNKVYVDDNSGEDWIEHKSD
jgi:hypothetical protein